MDIPLDDLLGRENKTPVIMAVADALMEMWPTYGGSQWFLIPPSEKCSYARWFIPGEEGKPPRFLKYQPIGGE